MTGSSILFIHPLGQNWTPGERDMSRVTNIMAPLGLLSLAAWVEQEGHQSAIHDCYAFPGENGKIFEYLEREQPDFVGFSATTSSFPDGVVIAGEIRRRAPRTRLIFGGVHLSALRENILDRYPVIDYGVVGEGEQTLTELMDGNPPAAIPGLIHRDRGRAVFNGFRKNLIEMDRLPLPAYDKLKGFPDSYQLPLFSYPRVPNTTMITSRGCPYTCSYCDRSVFRRSYRSNSPRHMVRMLGLLRERYRIRHVNIYDDTFTLDRRRVEAFCRQKIAAGIKTTFNCAARAEQLDADLLKLLKQAGCWMISLGIETGDPDLLARHRSYLPGDKVANPLAEIREKIRLIRKAGIRAKGLFMLGLPGETEESIARSMSYVRSLPLDDFNLSKLTPFPGAPIYQDIEQHGDFEEKWELMNALNFSFVPRGLTGETIERRYREFNKCYFSRPRNLLKYSTMIWKSPHSWKRFWKNAPVFFHFTRKWMKT